MPEQLDQKQKRIITEWVSIAHKYAADAEAHQSDFDDEINIATKESFSRAHFFYTAFIAMWVAFNALCNALYAKTAHKLMADIQTDRKKAKNWFDRNQPEENGEWFAKRSKTKCALDIKSNFGPEQLKINLKEKFLEQLVFSQFVKQFKLEYKKWMQDENFSKLVHALKESLTKVKEIAFVINMARKREYRDTIDITLLKEMAEKDIIVFFNDVNNLESLTKVLYQVRCNIFHGEKAPGVLNDDRIVRTAYPVLRELMKRVNNDLGIILN